MWTNKQTNKQTNEQITFILFFNTLLFTYFLMPIEEFCTSYSDYWLHSIPFQSIRSIHTLTVCLSHYLYLSLCLSVCLSIYQSKYLSLPMSFNISTNVHTFLHTYVCTLFEWRSYHMLQSLCVIKQQKQTKKNTCYSSVACFVRVWERVRIYEICR